MSQRNIRWGILGTANIARKNWKAIQLSGNSTVTAVASRDLERSRKFIAECQAQAPMVSQPQAFGSYEELLASDKIDAVYIPLPTGLRKEWVLRAAAAGKHVLCEKPCAVSVADLREMIDRCRQHRVQFMDGVMFMHSSRLPQLRELLDDGQSVGEVKRITSAFSFFGGPDFLTSNIRGNARLEPHGCLGDLGWYCIRFALWVMNWEMPDEVIGRILSCSGTGETQDAAPMEFSGELFFKSGVSASFYCSFITDNQEWAILSGTRGYVEVPDFVLPFAGNELELRVRKNEFSKNGCDFRMQAHTRRIAIPEHGNSHPTAQESNMFRNFSEQIQSGQLNELWPETALKTQQVMSACLDSAGNLFKPRMNKAL
jgi:predicted dehydrogenase